MDKTLGVDPLFLGLTRPAMVWGVPQPVFVINGMVSMIAFLVSNSFLPLLVGAPLIHGLAYAARKSGPLISGSPGRDSCAA